MQVSVAKWGRASTERQSCFKINFCYKTSVTKLGSLACSNTGIAPPQWRGQCERYYCVDGVTTDIRINCLWQYHGQHVCIVTYYVHTLSISNENHWTYGFLWFISRGRRKFSSYKHVLARTSLFQIMLTYHSVAMVVGDNDR